MQYINSTIATKLNNIYIILYYTIYIGNLRNRSLNFKMLRGPKWLETSLEGVRGTTRSLHLGGQKSLDKKYNIDVRDAHEL